VVVPAQLDYAIRGLVSLALATDRRTKVEVLASDHGLSRKFLAQILVTLRNAGIVTTHRGSSGGYGLARAPEQICLLDVFDLFSPGEDYEPRPTNESTAAAVTQEAWSQIRVEVRGTLSRLTLADVVAAGPPPPSERGDRTAYGLALETSGDSVDLHPGGREEIGSPRGA
jgi:Rrf2 family protein